MTVVSIEERVTALEVEMARLKMTLEARQATLPWWEHLAGVFQNDPIYDQAMRLGQHYRQALRPKRPGRA